MLVRRKERDVKFIIYQSLYIFVIATLGFHGLNLYDITKIPPKKVGDTTISKVNLDLLKSKIPPDSLDVRITQDSMLKLQQRILLQPDQEVISKNELQRLRNNQDNKRRTPPGEKPPPQKGEGEHDYNWDK